jgi:hypothetical protein
VADIGCLLLMSDGEICGTCEGETATWKKNDADNALAQTNASKKMRKVFADSAGLGGRNKQ